MHHWFTNPFWLTLLAALPVLGMLALWARSRRARALARVGNIVTLALLLDARRRRRWWRGSCWFLGLLLLGIAVAGPQWGRREDEGTSGRDLIVVLDCSRSMLAENPSRLRRARTALLDLTRELQRHGGHRLGLIAFAAHPRIACPLTQDYDFFREALGSEKDVEALPFDPELAAGGYDQSGTRIGAALKEALAARDERFPSACDILLISDGDDPAQDLEWEAGVREAASENTPIHVVGVGNPDPDESEATLIINKEAIRDPEGRPVQTRLMEGTLRAIAERTHGTYTAMQTRHAPLGQLYLNWIADKATRDNMDDRLPVPRPRYLWFLTPAFVLLCVAAVVPDRARRLGKVVESTP